MVRKQKDFHRLEENVWRKLKLQRPKSDQRLPGAAGGGKALMTKEGMGTFWDDKYFILVVVVII